jgi:surface protein
MVISAKGIPLRVTLFKDKSDFNDDISAWNVSSVTSIKGMLLGCETFNGDLSRWDVSNVNNMQFTFRGCSHILDKHNPKGDPV